MANSLQPCGLKHARLLCSLPYPGVCSNSCTLSQWCYLTINLCHLLLLLPSTFPVSGSFPMSWLLASTGQSIGASATVLPMNIQGWFPLGLTGLTSLLFKGFSRVCSTTIWKHQFYDTQLFFMVQLAHLYMTTGKTITRTIQTYVGKSMLFNTLCL